MRMNVYDSQFQAHKPKTGMGKIEKYQQSYDLIHQEKEMKAKRSDS